MKLTLLAAGILSIAIGRDPQPPETAALLDAMRAALGGETLKGVTTFIIGGKLERDAGGATLSFAVDLACQLPDKCVRRTRPYNVPSSFETWIYEGFDGERPVFRIDRSRRPGPPPPADRSSTAALFKDQFGRLQLALFGTAPAIYPLQFASAGHAQFDGRAMDTIELTREASTGTLFIDAATHLPAAIAWTAPPVVVSRPTAAYSAPPVGGPPIRSPLPPLPRYVPPGVVVVTEPPTPEMIAGLPLVEHQLEFSQFKTSGGITWPRRIIKRVQGHVTEAWRLDSVKINSKIDPRWFAGPR